MRDLKKLPALKVVFIVWLVFATLYVLYSEYTRLQVYVAKAAYNRGIQDSVTQLMAEASKCQPVPVSLGNQRIEVIAVSCLQKSETEAKKPTK